MLKCVYPFLFLCIIVYMLKKVLISGVSGMDGSTMADYLLENTDYEIYGMVRRLSVTNHINLENALKNKRFKLVTGDLSDSQSIDKLVEKIKPDYFINLAAQSFVGSSWDLPEQTMDINATGTMRCLEAIVRHCPNCRFYNAGSSEEFGNVAYCPQDENHPLRARSPYGASKIAARQVVKTYRESYDLYAIQGYLFNHEGPRRGEEFVTRKITKGVARIKYAIDNKLAFEPIELGNLDSKRDWSHSEDFVDGIWKMLNQDYCNTLLISQYYADRLDRNGLNEDYIKWYNRYWASKVKEYVLSSNETHSIKEFVELAFKYAGINGVWTGEGENKKFLATTYNSDQRDLKSDILVQINPKFYRPAEVDLLWGSSKKAREELNWQPKYSFQDLVKQMIDVDIKLANK